MATHTDADEHEVQDDIPTGDISEDELEGLSDEERAALLDDDEPEAVTEPEPEETAHDDQEATAAEASDEAEESEDGEEVQAEAGEETAEVSESAEVEPEPAELMRDPGREVGDLEAIDGKLGEIDQAIKALDEQVADGEIDLTDHIQQTRQLQDAKLAITLEKQDYIRNQRENQREVQIAWDTAIESFYADPSNKRYDSPDNGGNPVVFEAMSSWLGKLQQQQPGRSPAWYLSQAKKDVDSAFGGPQAAPEPAAKSKQRRKSALDGADIPRTLSDTPSAANNSVEGEFSHLDKLDGLDLEAAVAALSPSQMDRWARQ